MSAQRASGAGYSGTPLVRKLGIRDGHRLALLNAPPGFSDLLKDLPAGVKPVANPKGPKGHALFDVVVLFAANRAALTARLPKALSLMDPHGALWVSWPKGSSPLHRDLTEDGVRAAGLAAGVVDVKVCAVDADWSGLKLVVRVRDRPPRPSK